MTVLPVIAAVPLTLSRRIPSAIALLTWLSETLVLPLAPIKTTPRPELPTGVQ